jgi:hypothetical protein
MDQHFATRKCPFRGFGTKGPIVTGCSALLPDINHRSNLLTGPTRLRQEGWLQSRRSLEGNRHRGKAGARRTQEGHGVGPGPLRRRDPRHRTDPLGRLGQVRRAVLSVL